MASLFVVIYRRVLVRELVHLFVVLRGEGSHNIFCGFNSI